MVAMFLLILGVSDTIRAENPANPPGCAAVPSTSPPYVPRTANKISDFSGLAYGAVRHLRRQLQPSTSKGPTANGGALRRIAR